MSGEDRDAAPSPPMPRALGRHLRGRRRAAGRAPAALERDGFAVRATASGTEAVRSFSERPPDALVLDVGLPDADGRDVCQALRARGVDPPRAVPHRARHAPRPLSGFNAGGDDYLTKPFALAELLVRVQRWCGAAGRRQEAIADGSRSTPRRTRSSPATCGSRCRRPSSGCWRRSRRDPGEVVRRAVLVDAAGPTARSSTTTRSTPTSRASGASCARPARGTRSRRSAASATRCGERPRPPAAGLAAHARGRPRRAGRARQRAARRARARRGVEPAARARRRAARGADHHVRRVRVRESPTTTARPALLGARRRPRDRTPRRRLRPAGPDRGRARPRRPDRRARRPRRHPPPRAADRGPRERRRRGLVVVALSVEALELLQQEVLVGSLVLAAWCCSLPASRSAPR